MQLTTLTFSDAINFSLQIGDMVYYSPTATGVNSNFQTVNNYATMVEFGVVTNLFPSGNFSATPPIPINSIVVSYDDTTVNPAQINDYIMFSKNKHVNSSSLIGYYAEVELRNWSKKKIELFAVSSETSESSK